MPMELLARLQISNSGFVFDPHSGTTFSLNHTAVRLLGLLREGLDKDQLVETMAREYAIDSAHARRGVEDFMMSLKAL